MDFRIFFKKDGKHISPWHDIPLQAGPGQYHFVCEIPKETSAKMECATVCSRSPCWLPDAGALGSSFYLEKQVSL
jgi:hypothetical protein